MPRRGTLVAFVRRDDTVSTYPTIFVPGTWELVRESNRWVTVYPLTRIGSSDVAGQLREHKDVFFHARIIFSHATLARGLFVLCGHPYVLQYVADRVAADALPWTLTWPSLAALRADVTPAVQTMIGQIIDERPEGDAGSRARLFARIAGYDDDDGEG